MRAHLFLATLLLAACKGQQGDDNPTDDPPAPSCELGVPATLALARDRRPVVDFAEQAPGLARLDLAADDPITVTVSGPLQVWAADGSLVETGTSVPTASGLVSLWLQGTEVGEAQLSLATAACAAPADTAVTIAALPSLLHTELPGPPGWHPSHATFDGDTLAIGLDPRPWGLLGQTVDVYVQAHRDGADWLADPTLSDRDGAPRSLSLTNAGLNVLPLSLPVHSQQQLHDNYDIVVDVDGDGQLSAPDLVQGPGRPPAAVLANLTHPGPHSHARFEINQGQWYRMRVYHPETLDEPAPLVVISHGNGHDYQWYDYLGEHLASWGYVVMSHSNQTEPGIVTAAATTRNNTDALLANLDLAGGGVLDGKIDGSRIAWIGHSRGAEGVVYAYNSLRTGAESVSAYSHDDIKLLVSIAPTVFQNVRDSSAGPVPYAILSGSSDGDVTGGVTGAFNVPCGDCQWWRLFQTAEGPEHQLYLWGADHNDFNCCGMEDGRGNGPLIGRQRAQAVTKAYLLALVARYLSADDVMLEVVQGPTARIAPPEFEETLVLHDKRAGSTWEALDDFQPDTPLSADTPTLETTQVDWHVGKLDDPNSRFAHADGEPANGMTQSHNDGSVSAVGGMALWSASEAALTWRFPEPRDLRDIDALSFRAGQTTRHPYTTMPMSFPVRVEDSAGQSAVIDLGVYGELTKPYPRGGGGAGEGWANEFHTVRIPLASLVAANPDLALDAITAIHLELGAGGPEGQVGIDDLALERFGP